VNFMRPACLPRPCLRIPNSDVTALETAHNIMQTYIVIK